MTNPHPHVVQALEHLNPPPKRKSPTPRKKAKAAPKKRKAAGREANPVRTTDRVQWAMNYVNHVASDRDARARELALKKK